MSSDIWLAFLLLYGFTAWCERVAAKHSVPSVLVVKLNALLQASRVTSACRPPIRKTPPHPNSFMAPSTAAMPTILEWNCGLQV